MLKPPPPIERVSPDYPRHLSSVPCPLPRRTRQTLMSIASLSTRPSPPYGRVDVRIVSFEACLDFTHVTARWIAQPPKAAFVTRLRPGQLPNRSARQLPDQSPTLWVDSSSTGNTRRRGAPQVFNMALRIIGLVRACRDAMTNGLALGFQHGLRGAPFRR